jgi:hypothetical protein
VERYYEEGPDDIDKGKTEAMELLAEVRTAARTGRMKCLRI